MLLVAANSRENESRSNIKHSSVLQKHATTGKIKLFEKYSNFEYFPTFGKYLKIMETLKYFEQWPAYLATRARHAGRVPMGHILKNFGKN